MSPEQSEVEGCDLPRGTVVVTGDDVGVVGSVTVEIAGVPVCRLAPVQAARIMDGNMGRTESKLTFDSRGPVEWRGGRINA